jgi:hypothetical protein
MRRFLSNCPDAIDSKSCLNRPDDRGGGVKFRIKLCTVIRELIHAF